MQGITNMAAKLYYDERDLFGRYYPVRYRYHDGRSIESLRTYGVRSSGISSIDAEAANYMVDTELTIDQMFEMWRKGVTIRLVNYNDSAEIYEIIERHLNAVADLVRHTVNSSNKSLLIDMVDLDKFASVIHDKAKSIFTDRERAAVHSHSFAGIQTINFFNILNKDYANIEEVAVSKTGKEIVTKKNQISHAKAPVREREDLSKVFIEHLERVGGLGGSGNG